MSDIYIPSMTDAIRAFQSGRDVALDRRHDRATAEAGQLLMTGDYAGAAAVLAPHDVQAGLKLRQAGTEQEREQRRREIRAKYRTDPKGAMDAALEEDQDLYKDLRDLTDEAEKKRYGEFGAIIRTIGAQEPDRWDDLVAANRPRLVQLGIPEAEIDGFLAADDSGRRVMMASMLGRVDQFDAFQKERQEARKFEADEAARLSDDKRADAQLEVSRGQLGVSRANLGQRQAEHAARVAGKGGYAAPGMTYSDIPAGGTVRR